MRRTDTDGMAENDQTAPEGDVGLIRVSLIFPDLYVQKLRIITISNLKIK